MNTFEKLDIIANAMKTDEGTIKNISDWLKYDVESDDGKIYVAYAVKSGETWYKVPPIGCRTLNQISEFELNEACAKKALSMKVERRQSKRDYNRQYKYVSFSVNEG